VYKIRILEMTFACGTIKLICDASTSKHFFDTYLIAKIDVSLPLIPILKVLFFQLLCPVQ
jgi:hypothetical protein